MFPEGYESEYTEALGTHGRAEVVKYVKNGGKLLAISMGLHQHVEEKGVLDFTKAIGQRGVSLEKRKAGLL